MTTYGAQDMERGTCGIANGSLPPAPQGSGYMLGADALSHVSQFEVDSKRARFGLEIERRGSNLR